MVKWIVLLVLGIAQVHAEKKEVKLYQDDVGIWMESEYLTMHVGGLINVDGDYFTNTDEGNSTFVLRRARIFVEGNIYDMFRYLVTGRWDFWQPKIHDTYIESLWPKYAQVRVGYSKIPFSMENLYPGRIWEFTEKSIGTTNFIQRDTGLQIFGSICENRLQYHIGIYNGRFPEADNNNSKDVVGRLVFSPYTCYGDVYFGASGLIGKRTEDLSGDQFITGSGNINGAGIPFYTFGEDVFVNTQRVMWGADFEWLYGPFAFRAEYLNVNWGDIIMEDELSVPFKQYSWFMEVTYNITGEVELRNKALIPLNIFKWGNCGGAWQIVARYEWFHINSRTITEDFAFGANAVKGFTVGLNWIINPFVLTRLDWQYLDFNRAVRVRDHFIYHESLITGRIQAAF